MVGERLRERVGRRGDSPSPARMSRARSLRRVLAREDVVRARATIGGRLHRTPTFTSRTLGDAVFLKAELFQKTGSFKPRGVLNKLASMSPDEKRRGVITISAGNHAQAVAWGAAAEGIDALVVMWSDASTQKIAATRGYGATVDVEAAGPTEAFGRLAELQGQARRTPRPPVRRPLPPPRARA